MLQTDKSSVGGKKTTNKNPTKNMGNLYFVVTQSWQAIPHGFWRNLQALQKQYHMGSEGISRIFKRHFGLFRVNSSIKGDS
jgi:hypothetical protein